MAQRVIWDAEADWTQFYRVRVRTEGHPLYGQTVTYGREWAAVCEEPGRAGLTRFERRRDHLVALGIVPSDRVLVVGSGFGFLVDAFHDAGYANVWGLDSSSHVDANRTEIRGDTVVVSDDIRGGGRMRAALRSATGDDEFDWIVTESVVESYDDADVQVLCNVCEGGLTGTDRSRIVHLVMDVLTDVDTGEAREPRDRWIDPAFNQKTLAEWNALRPDHTWMSYVTWETL